MITIIPDDDGQRLDRWLKKNIPHINFIQAQKLIRTGQIRLDGKRVKPDTRLQVGQELRLPPQISEVPRAEELDTRDAEFIRSLILYEDDFIIALNKPSGLAVQGGSKIARHIDGLLPALARDDIKPRLVHRIDKETSGILLIARTAEMARRLTDMFATRDIEKTYLALTIPSPKENKGRIDAPLAKGIKSDDIEKMILDNDVGKSAITDYAIRNKADDGRAALVSFYPLTGRTHQIRVHAAHIGCPLLGDVKYGGLKHPGKLHLHAARMTFKHPKTGKGLQINAPLPEKFIKSCKNLGISL